MGYTCSLNGVTIDTKFSLRNLTETDDNFLLLHDNFSQMQCLVFEDGNVHIVIYALIVLCDL
jgi:hypothetical protein